MHDASTTAADLRNDIAMIRDLTREERETLTDQYRWHANWSCGSDTNQQTCAQPTHESVVSGLVLAGLIVLTDEDEGWIDLTPRGFRIARALYESA